MDQEIKRVDFNWCEKGSSQLNALQAYETLLEIDEALQACEKELDKIGLGIGYTSKSTTVDKVMEDRTTLLLYIESLQEYVEEKIDKPLYNDFKKNATETISRIRLENFEVDNTVGLTENVYIPGGMGYPGTSTTLEADSLTFADFIGTSDGQADTAGLSISYTNGSVEDFAQIFAGQYEAMLAAGILGEDNEMTQQEFLEQFYKQGEFDHDSSDPFLNFVSSILDITIVKPIIEACIGEDLITGEDLTDLERGLKVVFALVDLATLGGAIAATKISEVGLKEGLQAFGKTVLIDFASNTAACGVGALGEAFDWPMPVTIMLSLATGITVSISGNKLLFKNADGIKIAETVLDDNEIKIVDDMLDEKAILSSEEAEEIAFNAIQGSDGADAVVLGKFDAVRDDKGEIVLDANGNAKPTDKSYNRIAEEMGAQYFQLDNWNELAVKYDDSEIWKINEKFLDIQTSSGREIYLSHNPDVYRGDGSFYSLEIEYLEKNGYRFVKEGDVWHAIR